MRPRFKQRLVDKMIDAYIEWRGACRAVNDAYRCWVRATGRGSAVAYRRYAEALDTEESAADAYAGLVRRVGRFVASENAVSGRLGSRARGAIRL